MKTLVLGGGPAAEALDEALRSLGERPERRFERPGPARFDLVAAVGAGAALAQTCRELRALIPNASILAVMVHDPPENAEALLEAGATDLIAYPEAAPILRARVRAMLLRAEADAVERERAEKFKLLFNNQLDAISICDLDSGRFVEVNDAWVSLYGYTPEEAIGRMGPKDVSAEPGPTLAAIVRVEEEARCLQACPLASLEARHPVPGGDLRRQLRAPRPTRAGVDDPRHHRSRPAGGPAPAGGSPRLGGDPRRRGGARDQQSALVRDGKPRVPHQLAGSTRRRRAGWTRSRSGTRWWRRGTAPAGSGRW